MMKEDCTTSFMSLCKGMTSIANLEMKNFFQCSYCDV